MNKANQGAAQQTHWEGCWQDSRHYACAVAEIERLRVGLDLAFQLGQEFWRLADSEFDSDHKKADLKMSTFRALKDALESK